MVDIKKLANKIANQYHSRDPFEIIKGLNIILVFVPLVGVKGFYQHFQRNNIIYIDESLTYREKQLVCAHELGHMLLHKKSNALFMDAYTGFNMEKYELEANKFAVELLVSDEIILENKEITISKLSQMIGYNEELIKLKFK